MTTIIQPLTAAQAQRRRADEDVLQYLHEYRISRDPELRDKIVLQYTSLVESIARRFSAASEPVEDLTQEGYIGLITAVDLYDPTKNVKFSTYATHFIIGQIKHCLRDRGKIIKEPAWLQELNQKMTRAIEALAQELSRPPSNFEIGQVMGMTEEAVADVMMTREVFKLTSIDGGSENEEDSGTLNIERQVTADVAVTFQLPLEEKIVLEAAMEKLKELEQKVVIEFYFKDLNQTEIAAQLGISCNYVSHILRNSTKKLKKILITDEHRDTQMKMNQLKKRLQDQQAYIEQVTVVDSLTRLYNRSYYNSRLDEELSRASRLGSEVAILYVRIDGLDSFTRACGTLKGDEAVVSSAEIIKRTVRRSDILTRCGEDTFALILPHTGANVRIVEERLMSALVGWMEEKGWHDGRSPISFRMGSAVYPRDATQPEALSTFGMNDRRLAIADNEQQMAA